MSARARQITWAIVGLLTGALVAAVLAAAVTTGQIRDAQVERQPQNEKNDQTLAAVKRGNQRVKGCVTPGGECYERGQQQSRDVLASAQRIIVVSAACSIDLDPADSVETRVQQITSCVTQRLVSNP